MTSHNLSGVRIRQKVPGEDLPGTQGTIYRDPYLLATPKSRSQRGAGRERTSVALGRRCSPPAMPMSGRNDAPGRLVSTAAQSIPLVPVPEVYRGAGERVDVGMSKAELE